jgi:protein arginine kinase
LKTLAELARRAAPWLVDEAPERDIVLSSRVRLARNLDGRNFTHLVGDEDLRSLGAEVAGVAGELSDLQPVSLWAMEQLNELERRFLLERHLISVDLVRNLPGRLLLVSEDEAAGIMVNEEDHLRLQTFASGLSLHVALERAMDLARELDERILFAFDDQLGFLTACPTNVGTGMRASILLHLPGLVHTGDLDRVLNSLRRLNYTVRGFYGEGSGVMGALFQVSNSVTLGRSESGIVEDLLRHTRKVIDCERQARQALLVRGSQVLEDRVWRAYGVLRHSRLLSTKEAFERLSDVRLGASLGLLPGVDESVLNMLLINVQSAHLQIAAGRSLDTAERDERRARYVREQLTTNTGDGKDRS